MNISLLANLAFTFRVLFVGKTLGGKIMFFFFKWKNVLQQKVLFSTTQNQSFRCQ